MYHRSLTLAALLTVLSIDGCELRRPKLVSELPQIIEQRGVETPLETRIDANISEFLAKYPGMEAYFENPLLAKGSYTYDDMIYQFRIYKTTDKYSLFIYFEDKNHDPKLPRTIPLNLEYVSEDESVMSQTNGLTLGENHYALTAKEFDEKYTRVRFILGRNDYYIDFFLDGEDSSIRIHLPRSEKPVQTRPAEPRQKRAPQIDYSYRVELA